MKQEWFIAYDITDNDLRNQAANICKNYGLERIQYSIFYGETSKNKIEEIALKLKTITLKHNASILIIPNCQACQKKQIIIHNEEPNKKQENTDKNKNKNKNKNKSKKKNNNDNDNNHDNNEKQKSRKRPKPKDEVKEEKQQRVIFA